MNKPLVLVVDDEENLRRVLGREIASMGYLARVAANADEALERLGAEEIAAVVLDLKMPGRDGLDLLPEIKRRWPNVEVIMLTGHGSVETAIEAMRKGAYDYQQKPCHLDELEQLLTKALEKRTLTLHAQALLERPETGIEWGGSPAMERVRSDLLKAAPTDAPVLILGESGTGKELVARELHARSAVADGRFVVVNCGAIPSSLVESTLFGHEKGAFTGAERRKLGLAEVAHRGTLFLDEVGELPLDAQVKLLRFLQSGEVLRVGATEPVQVDVRVVAATNVDVDQAIRKGDFREDLLYRLETIRLQLPPLRERSGDVSLLAQRFLAELGAKHHAERKLADEALQELEEWPWPGNVRELRRVIERLAILAEGEEITAEDVHERLGTRRQIEPSGSGDPQLVPLRTMERRMIVTALHRLAGDKPRAAKALGIALKTLYNKIKTYEIDVPAAIAGTESTGTS